MVQPAYHALQTAYISRTCNWYWNFLFNAKVNVGLLSYRLEVIVFLLTLMCDAIESSAILEILLGGCQIYHYAVR